jgi:hypothetical protein
MMARKVTEIEINSETTWEELELCAHAADHSSDTNLQRISANARAEIDHRRRQFSMDLLNAQSRERVDAQKAQAALVERQIETQEAWMGQQLEVAREHAGAAGDAAEAATQSARSTRWMVPVTMVLAVATFLLAAATAGPLVLEWLSAPAVEEVQPSPAATKNE